MRSAREFSADYTKPGALAAQPFLMKPPPVCVGAACFVSQKRAGFLVCFPLILASFAYVLVPSVFVQAVL
jgi:hypothetical protein